MESSTIIVGEDEKPNSTAIGGTKNKTYRLKIARNDFASLGSAAPDCC
jgi:hypothetical protein